MTRLNYAVTILLFLTAAGATKLVWKEQAAIAQHSPMEQGAKGAGPTEMPSMSEHKTAGHDHPMGHMKGHVHAKLQPAEGASVKILSPKPNQKFTGDEIPIHFTLIKGKRAAHAHAYVDGELMGMFTTEKGSLTGVRPGRHTLELRAATKDHHELDASDRVHFVVK